jgi:hypothetical protein
MPGDVIDDERESEIETDNESNTVEEHENESPEERNARIAGAQNAIDQEKGFSPYQTTSWQDGGQRKESCIPDLSKLSSNSV